MVFVGLAFGKCVVVVVVVVGGARSIWTNTSQRRCRHHHHRRRCCCYNSKNVDIIKKPLKRNLATTEYLFVGFRIVLLCL